MLKRSQLFALVAVVTAAAACGTETIVHKLDEKEANDIVVLLARSEIIASKQVLDDGRTITYNIAVPAGRRIEAMQILKQHDHPKRPVRGYNEVFGESGLIPTAAEEKAKKLAAIEGEIEKQLRVVNDILDAEVNIVMPEESPLKTAEDAQTPTTASVTVRFLPGKGGTHPLSIADIQNIVAAGVEKLTRDHVVVVMTPAGSPTGAEAAGECPEMPAGTGLLAKLSPALQRIVAIAGPVLLLLMAIVVVFLYFRLTTVRGRLIRLQNEIAKARRKPLGEGSVG